MKITIRTPQMQDYDRFSAIMDQVQQMHVDWRRMSTNRPAH